MHIEEKSSGTFLVKKVGKKSISTKIDHLGITKSVLQSISEKEADILCKQDFFHDFNTQLHSSNTLQDLVIRSKFLINIISVLDLVKSSDPIYKESDNLNLWMNKIFPAEFILHSNHIEGSKISDLEIRKILANKKSDYKVKNEIIEVQNTYKSWLFL